METQDPKKTVIAVMRKYGISLTAAGHHVKNVTGAELSDSEGAPLPSNDWLVSENLTVDFFPLKTTPISRRGRFAGVVLAALREGCISIDTAAAYLKSNPSELANASEALEEIFKPTSSSALTVPHLQ